MLPVTTAATTRALDQACIDGLGIPGRQLMEVAGLGVAEHIHARWPTARITVLCGPGNNGGDGYVIARWLTLWGHVVSVWASGVPATEDARRNAALCARQGLSPQPLPEAMAHADVVVDALLGTGQTGAPRGAIQPAVVALAATDAAIVAVDLPTGVHSDTGQALGDYPVRAALTVTLGRHKPGLFAMPGATLVGEVVLVDIGLDLAAVANSQLARPDAWLIEADDVANWMPGRDPAAAKWDRGHVAIIGGGGASVLAAMGAMSVGAGLVTVMAPRDTWPRLHGLSPAIILAEPDALNPKRHDVVVIGPGLGTDQIALVDQVWNEFSGSVVADADALTILAAEGETWRHPGEGRLITPHSAEAARLLGCSRDEVDADRFAAVNRLGRGAVLKGPCTLIGEARPYINPTGSARLAIAGTGDVLAGMIGGLLGQGLAWDQAAGAACWLHGDAGDRMADNGTAVDVAAAVRLQPGAAK